MSTPLHIALESAIAAREDQGISVSDPQQELPNSGPDLFSSDYLSVTTISEVRQTFLERLAKEPLVFRSPSSHPLAETKNAHAEFEQRMATFFRADSALLLNSGYHANVAFWRSVPQNGDAIVFDEFVHASVRDGVAASRCSQAAYTFSHNSVSSLRERIALVLQTHPKIAAGNGTVFFAVETLYSMDGDFAPLRDIVQAVEDLVPRGCAHIVVDESHTTGLLGPDGRGLVVALGLEKQVGSVVHSFSKVWGMSGAVFLTSALIRQYLIDHGGPVIQSTALPLAHLCALNTTIDYVTSLVGAELRERLHLLVEYFDIALARRLKDVSKDRLCLGSRAVPSDFPKDVFSPLFPLLSQSSKSLCDFLKKMGYAAAVSQDAIVPQGKEHIQVVIHAGNTKEELDEFISRLLQWVEMIEAL
ncbi:PLP-dependent transferase [Fomes fomentarius]|nr:PLP-dependent transferase [Fomes fomentarius]